MLDHVIHLLSQSELHKVWTVEQITRCIIPPVNLNQHAGMFENGYLVAWASWAFLSEEKSDSFLEGDMSMTPNDWRSGNVLVFMDIVAPYGHCRPLIRKCRNLFPKYPKAEWRRHTKNKRVGAMLNV